MPEWSEFAAAFVVFFLSHSIPVRPRIKAQIASVIGGRGFTLTYSALSVAVLSWLIVAAGRAPYVALWDQAVWQRYVPLGAMLAASIILALGLGRPNPLSFGGARNDAFDPADPGIVGWIRHPLLFAIGLWAGAHILPNGDLAHVILFGVFLGFAAGGTRIIDRRKRRLLGLDWDRLSRRTRRITLTRSGAMRILIGAAIYAALLWLHIPVIGVSPYP